MSPENQLLTRLGGQGPDVVLLHGFGSDRQSWLATTPAVLEYSTVWVLDLPGHGQSAGQADSDGSVQALTAYIAHAITAAGLSQYHLIGHSLGGRLALELTRCAPAATLSMVLLAPAGIGAGINQAFLTEFANAADAETVTAVLKTLTHDPRLISPTLGTGVLKYLETPGTRAALLAIASGLVDAQADVEALSKATLQNGKTPRMCIWGVEDRINPPDVEKIALLGGQTHLLENCGHLPHIEKRVQVNRLIASFHESIME